MCMRRCCERELHASDALSRYSFSNGQYSRDFDEFLFFLIFCFEIVWIDDVEIYGFFHDESSRNTLTVSTTIISMLIFDRGIDL